MSNNPSSLTSTGPNQSYPSNSDAENPGPSSNNEQSQSLQSLQLSQPSQPSQSYPTPSNVNIDDMIKVILDDSVISLINYQGFQPINHHNSSTPSTPSTPSKPSDPSVPSEQNSIQVDNDLNYAGTLSMTSTIGASATIKFKGK